MASKQLLSNFGKKGDSSYTTTGVAQGLADIQVDIIDTAHLSTYFHVVEFNPVFTAGKNSISFNGSDFLKDGSEIKVEVLDGDGNSLYLASPSKKSNYVDIANFTVVIYVYRETVSGAGSVILVGTTPKGEIVRWTGNITINTTYPNVSRVRFYNAPTMEATPLLYPVIESATGSLLVSSSFIGDTCSGQSIKATGFVMTATTNIFTSQMVGQSLVLYYGQSVLLKGESAFGTYDLSSGNYGATSAQYIIKKVINSKSVILKVINNEGQLVSTGYNLPYKFISPPQQPVNTVINGFSGGRFTMNYTHVTYIPQGTRVPCNGEWLNYNYYYPAPDGYLELKTNTDVFDITMVGKTMKVNFSYVWLSQGGGAFDPSIPSRFNLNPQTSSFLPVPIVAVIDSRTVQVPPAFFFYTLYYNYGQTSYTFVIEKFSGSIEPPTSSNPYQQYTTVDGSSSLMRKSYVDIVYRNTDTFTGFVARHKLYAKSNIYPGDFNLVADSTVGPTELLIDQITVNKAYAFIGVFETQDKVNQYWLASSASFNLVQSDDKMSSAMTIATNPDYSAATGNSYVITKASAIGLVNDAIYHPFDALEFAQFSGAGYASNFIFLPQNVLHVLSANMIVDKDRLATAKIEFYFTSSFLTISGERDYSPTYGWKLGTITVADKVERRIFPDVQQMFFKPLNDYYGTLVIVPYNCDVTLTNISMQNYGDYGFSPGAIELQLPFPINVANESYTFKAELFDTNANLVYTIPTQGDPPVVQTFDPTGASLFGSSVLGSAGGTGGIPSTLPSLTIQSALYLPGIGQCPSVKRLLGFNIPTHHPPLSGEGAVCYTDVTDLELTASNASTPTIDYLSLSTTAGNGKSLAVRYSGTSPNVYGRRVYVDPSGVKTTYL